MSHAEPIYHTCCCGYDDEYINAEMNKKNDHASVDRLNTLILPVSIYLVIGMLWFLAATMIGTSYPGTVGDLSSLADFTIAAVISSYIAVTWPVNAMGKPFVNFVNAILTVAVLFSAVFIAERSWRYTGCDGPNPIDPTDPYEALLCPNWKILLMVISIASAMTFYTIFILGFFCCWDSYRAKRDEALNGRDKFHNH